MNSMQNTLTLSCRTSLSRKRARAEKYVFPVLTLSPVYGGTVPERRIEGNITTIRIKRFGKACNLHRKLAGIYDAPLL